MLPHLFVSPTSMQQALTSFKMVISFACLLSVRPLLSSMAVLYENRELKQRRPRRQRERHKGNRLSFAKNNSAYAFLLISLPSMHDYDVKMPNFTFCGGHEQKTTFFFVSYNLTQSFRIQLQKNLPTFDELNEMEQTRLSFRQSEFTF